MNNFITKDEDIKTTPVYIGYLILKLLKKSNDGKVSIFELNEKLKGELKVVHYRQLVLSLSFLHAVGIVDFSEPYLYRLCE